MEKSKKGIFTNVLLVISLVMLLISAAVTITLNFRPLYYHDIKALDIPSYSGLSEDVIKENYDALIDYNSIFDRGELDFPSLAMSKQGKIHFEEVKAIFVAVEAIMIITLIASAIGIVLKIRRKKSDFLKHAAVAAVLIPVVLALLIAISWESFFTLFHKIFFNNDYWIFSAETDPVITILPSEFFMHCALMILALIIIGAVICFIASLILKKRFIREDNENK